MDQNQIRSIIRQIITEAKKAKDDKKAKKVKDDKTASPKSSGKLVDLKKELGGLKKMKESLNLSSINEGETELIVAEYSHMQRFINEIEKIKAMTAKLAEMLDNQINEVENKIKSETNKIKEMIGLESTPDVVDEKLKPSMGAGAYVKDFEKSKAPQFKGKSKEKKDKMAVAAYLTAKDKKKK